jgi:Fructose-2,6-bisphosphatase
MTTLYLIRHSGPFVPINNYDNKTFEEQSKNMILSVEAEQKASLLSKIPELKNVDEVYSSNSARAIATAKYIAYENNKEINIANEINERLFGVEYISELPKGFIDKQFSDENYKLKLGESLLDVNKRSLPFFNKIISKDNKNIVIVLHGIILMNILKNFCDVQFFNDKFKVIHNGKLIFEEILNRPPEIFELSFEKQKLKSIKNII